MTERKTIDDFGYAFIAGDEYRHRNIQTAKHPWRQLSQEETVSLRKQGNTAGNWNDILVTDPFDPSLITSTTFYGLVRIGVLQKAIIQYHDFAIPEGIYDSFIVSCDIGDHVSITDCHYLSHYLIGDQVILHDVSEMQTTNHAKFGVGVVKEGENPSVRVTISVMNEAEGRAIRPFVSMTTADAWLWAKYRTDHQLLKGFETMTDNSVDLGCGWYGKVEDGVVIKQARIIKDVDIGRSCYIKGANKLKNLTILSSEEEPTQLGEGIELVNGIIGYGSRIFYGCKAVRFVMGDHCNLKYGARLINSVLGDNSTVSCCEMLSNLIFPGHEQHHNNSFLIAACIKGQSNMAAGANIGSNHNSRGADGELVAGRGFWPALSSTLKYDSSFASFLLITKGNYPHEMDIKLPFSLLASDPIKDERVVMPAYWWMYNLYALERNSWKFTARDKRKHPRIIYETDYLAPDTAGEMLQGMHLLAGWTGKAWGKMMGIHVADLHETGWRLLAENNEQVDQLRIYGEDMECSSTPIRILKAKEGWNAYRTMLNYYGLKSILAYLAPGTEGLEAFDRDTPSETGGWVNCGGQLVPEERLERLKAAICKGEITRWEEVHATYGIWNTQYPYDKARNAITILRSLWGKEHLQQKDWMLLREELARTRSYIEEQVFRTKEKDYQNPFRMVTYETTEERDAVLGSVNDNPFINESKEMTKAVLQEMEKVFSRT